MKNASARKTAWRVLHDWTAQQQPIDTLLHDRLACELPGERDRALATELVYGVLRHRRKLDHYLRRLRGRGELDTATRAILHLGLWQLIGTRIPPHAAVHETVSQAPARARPLVNALLRAFLRQRRELESETLPDAVRWSHPDFLIERWSRQFGAEKTRQLAEWNNQPPPLYARVNTLKADARAFVGGHPEAVTTSHPLVVRLDRLPKEALQRGECYIQDPSTLVPCELLDPQPNESILDACAAPGGKTTYLAALMSNQGRILALDTDSARVGRLRENLARLGVRNTKTGLWKKETPPPGSFDAVLTDVPCSNTGVLRRRVDARWRLGPEDFSKLPRQQSAILEQTAALVKPGGRLVYSTCSLEPEENDLVVEHFLKAHLDFELAAVRRGLPFDSRQPTDGAYAALMKRIDPGPHP